MKIFPSLVFVTMVTRPSTPSPNGRIGSSPGNFGYIELFSTNVPHCFEFIQFLFTTIYIEMTSICQSILILQLNFAWCLLYKIHVHVLICIKKNTLCKNK